MRSDVVCNPVEVNKLKEFLVAEQKSINKKRVEQLHQLRLGPHPPHPVVTNLISMVTRVSPSCNTNYYIDLLNNMITKWLLFIGINVLFSTVTFLCIAIISNHYITYNIHRVYNLIGFLYVHQIIIMIFYDSIFEVLVLQWILCMEVLMSHTRTL